MASLCLTAPHMGRLSLRDSAGEPSSSSGRAVPGSRPQGVSTRSRHLIRTEASRRGSVLGLATGASVASSRPSYVVAATAGNGSPTPVSEVFFTNTPERLLTRGISTRSGTRIPIFRTSPSWPQRGPGLGRPVPLGWWGHDVSRRFEEPPSRDDRWAAWLLKRRVPLPPAAPPHLFQPGPSTSATAMPPPRDARCRGGS